MAIIRQKPNMFGGGTPTLSQIETHNPLSIDIIKGCNIHGNYMYYGQYDTDSESHNSIYNIYRKNLTTGEKTLFKYTGPADNYKKWSLVVNGLNGSTMYILLHNYWGSDVYALDLTNGYLTYRGVIFRSGSISGHSSVYAIYANNKIYLIDSNETTHCFDLSTNTTITSIVYEYAESMIYDGSNYIYYITGTKLKRINERMKTAEEMFTFESGFGTFRSYFLGYLKNSIYFFFVNVGSSGAYMYSFNVNTKLMKKIDNTDYSSYVGGINGSQAVIINKYAYFPLNAKYGKLR